MWLPDGEKVLMLCLFVLTQSTNVTDTHTQTPHNGIGAAKIGPLGGVTAEKRFRHFASLT